jgi:hypothetical protein
LNFRACSGFAPEIQLGANLLRTFTDARQSPMPGLSPFLQDLVGHTFSIVADKHPKEAIPVSNLSLDVTCTRVLKGIS